MTHGDMKSTFICSQSKNRRPGGPALRARWEPLQNDKGDLMETLTFMGIEPTIKAYANKQQQQQQQQQHRGER